MGEVLDFDNKVSYNTPDKVVIRTSRTSSLGSNRAAIVMPASDAAVSDLDSTPDHITSATYERLIHSQCSKGYVGH